MTMAPDRNTGSAVASATSSATSIEPFGVLQRDELVEQLLSP
jgi:hypothetical protein